MIQERLVAAIRSAFPDREFRFSDSGQPMASIASPCERLGEVAIYDDGDEVMVELTGATRSHFACYDEHLSREGKEERICADVIAFLEALFADRVVVWCVAGGLAGGWRMLTRGEELPKRSLVRRQFVWSREIV
ncbi:MAG: hypothetical protein ACYC6Y_15365 [Thermoguttaceae bacterium]